LLPTEKCLVTSFWSIFQISRQPRRIRKRVLRRRPWGRNSTFFAVIVSVFLSRNLNQSMFKNAFFRGDCKNRLSVGGSAPESPFASGGWGSAPRPPRCYSWLLLQLCQVYFLVEKCVLFRSKKTSNYSKCSAFAFSALFTYF